MLRFLIEIADKSAKLKRNRLQVAKDGARGCDSWRKWCGGLEKDLGQMEMKVMEANGKGKMQQK